MRTLDGKPGYVLPAMSNEKQKDRPKAVSVSRFGFD
jgi:hypothetical protein